MESIKDNSRFAEIEHLVEGYFHSHLAPVMRQTRA